MLGFHRRQHFSKRVHSHVVSRTIDKLDGVGIYDITDEGIMNIDMFGASMVVAIVGERYSLFAVAEQVGRCFNGAK